MKPIEFNQQYYLKRAAELGITYTQREHSLPMVGRDRPGRRDGPRSMKIVYSRWEGRVSGRGQRVGKGWDGYAVESFGPKRLDPLRDWEWEEPNAEVVSDVVWSEDEVEGESMKVLGSAGKEERSKDAGCGGGGVGSRENGVVDGGCGRMRGKDGDGRGRWDVPPRGKSWMIATEKMIKDYTPYIILIAVELWS
jgi:hypothetical protein